MFGSSHILLRGNKKEAYNMLIMRLEASPAIQSTTDSDAAYKRQSVGSRFGRLWKKPENAESHGLPVQTGMSPLVVTFTCECHMCMHHLIACSITY